MASIHISSERLPHVDHMPGIGGAARSSFDFRAATVCRVRVCSFTFLFRNPEQLIACLEFYSRKIQLSGRISRKSGGDHWEYLRWFDKPPIYLREEPKRIQVVKALERALCVWRMEPEHVALSSLQRRGRSEWTVVRP